MKKYLLLIFAALALVTSCSGVEDAAGGWGSEEATTTVDPSPDDGGSTPSTTVDTSDPLEDALRTAGLNQADASALVPTFESDASTPEEGMLEFSDFVVGNLDQVWTEFFASQNLAEPYVTIQYVQTGQQVTTNCTDPQGNTLVVVADTPNAFYCPADAPVDDATTATYTHPEGALLLPLQTLLSIRDTGVLGDRASVLPGDFAVAFILAHEFGHHVADELASQLSLTEPVGKDMELLADCLAGNWAYTAYYNDLLEAGDWEEGIALLEILGDVDIRTESSHGTAEERIAAFQTGYDTGDVLACVNTYWAGR